MNLKNYMNLGGQIFQFNNSMVNNSEFIELIFDDNWKSWERANGEKIGQIRFIDHNNDNVFYNYINNAVKKTIQEYFEINKIDLKKYTYSEFSYNVKKWDAPTSGMEPHPDFTTNENGERVTPAFTLCAYLTNEYVGGHLEFPKHNISIKPPAGSIIIFPSDELHAVSDLISGNRIMFSIFIFNLDGGSEAEK